MTYFTARRVSEPEDLRRAYRIRYEVFCLEKGFLRPEDYPDEEESDAFDAHALHVLASHSSGYPAGTARLVLNGPLGLPLLGRCELEPRYGFLADPGDPRGRGYAEISRLAVSPAYRRRRDDGDLGGPPRADRSCLVGAGAPAAARTEDVSEMLPQVFRLIYQESKRRGITHWVVAMERGLHVMLRRMGLRFTPIGPETDYHGPVRPYLAEIAALEFDTGLQRRAALAFMTAGLETRLRPRMPPVAALPSVERAQPLRSPLPPHMGAGAIANRAAAG
jgi:N-acyl amino acid synthase of PEP-CTERM/exosortase system